MIFDGFFLNCVLNILLHKTTFFNVLMDKNITIYVILYIFKPLFIVE